MEGAREMAPTREAAARLLFELQVEQFQHDENYHREIARLSMHQRVNHMALHFAKYAGKIASTDSVAAHTRIYTDTLIIALSTANILNLDLWEILEPNNRAFVSLLAFGRALSSDLGGAQRESDSLLREVVIAAGRMAAACEKIDHLEAVPFRSEITQCIARLSVISLAFITEQGIDPPDAVRARLKEVKQKLKLHGRI